MALAGAFPLPSIAGSHDDRRGIEVLCEEDEDTESSEDESRSPAVTDDSGAHAVSTPSLRLLRSQDPRALEAVIEGALGPNPPVSRTPSPWLLDTMDTQERFTTEHRTRPLAGAHLKRLARYSAGVAALFALPPCLVQAFASW